MGRCAAAYGGRANKNMFFRKPGFLEQEATLKN
jgi:hypothetical protein